ncbi:protein YgfX [Paraburkholderia sp. J8-2]|uniref:protein YgfX n=1 Tax=Paraburkholderia sp. J8-2 TaxID=2805440 RepID=UPI002AB6011A|nr:protein YgfX [Paraburkholderia sp. J8-2]
MIPQDETAAAPNPSAGRVPAFPSRRSLAPLLSLRPSLALQLLVALGLSVATAAVYAALAPWLGGWQALPVTLAFLATAGLVAAAWRRKQPAFIEIGSDYLAAYSRDGACLAAGRLAGAAQWGTWLLALVVEQGARRATILVAADAVAADTFRTLAVRARSAAGR